MERERERESNTLNQNVGPEVLVDGNPFVTQMTYKFISVLKLKLNFPFASNAGHH